MIIGNESLSRAFDNSVAHIETKAVWFVPSAQQIAQWKNLTIIFDKEVWLAILLIFIINGTIWWLVGRKKEKRAEFKDLILCIMGSFRVLLQGNVKNPKNNLLRMLVITWTMSCLLLFTAHQCQLTGILTSPMYEHQISNLEELVTSDLEYGVYPILLNLFNNVSWTHKKVRKNSKYCSLDTTCLNRTAVKRDFGTIKNERQGKYMIPKYYSSPDGKPMLYGFKDFVFVCWCHYYTMKGHPFLQRINSILLRLQSSGLIAKWEASTISEKKRGTEISHHQSLTLDHLAGAFYLLILGLLTSIITFVIEKIHFFVRKRCQKKVIDVITE